MKPSDQLIKLRLVLLVAIFSLVGFFLEIGPLGGAFSLPTGGVPIGNALSLELPALGFLAYFALAASAAVGLHLGETEPTPKEKDEKAGTLDAVGDGEMTGEAVRVRPELHQARMVFTALGGYILLKGISLGLMWQVAPRFDIERAALVQAFQFGFFYTALGWLVMWQFLRWFAQRRRWVRLQDELVGGNVLHVVAFTLLIKPIIYFFTLRSLTLTPLTAMSLLLHLMVIIAAIFLWTARPLMLKRTVAGLLVTGGIAIILTIALALFERTAT